MKQLLNKYRKRLTIEGVLKALVIAAVTGFSVVFIAALFSWMTEIYLKIEIVLLIGITSAITTGVISYFIKFRPTQKSIARRVDKLGLEERFITMLDYADDNSYIACRQRDDAKEMIDKTDDKEIKFNLSKKAIAIASTCAVVGVSMSVLTALSAAGILASGLDLIDPDHDAPVTFTITYEAQKGGVVEGDAIQVLELGVDKAEQVVAVADDGWVFVGWDDGSGKPFRVDQDVTVDTTFVAIFEELDEVLDDDPDLGDFLDDVHDYSKDPNEDSKVFDPDADGDPTDEGSNNRDMAINKVINGDIYYKDVVDDYEEDSKDKNAEDDDMPEDLKDFVNSYYGGL